MWFLPVVGTLWRSGRDPRSRLPGLYGRDAVPMLQRGALEHSAVPCSLSEPGNSRFKDPRLSHHWYVAVQPIMQPFHMPHPPENPPVR